MATKQIQLIVQENKCVFLCSPYYTNSMRDTKHPRTENTSFAGTAMATKQILYS